jgi:hypothetical protein
MIGKIIPGTCDAYNNVYCIQSDVWAGSLASNPFGCQWSTGGVSVPSWMETKVVLDALAEMTQIEANILEDLGQLKQTGELIRSIYNTIVNGFRLARDGLWKNLRRLWRSVGVNTPRTVGNGWLVYFYGIKPLISTIEALAKAAKPLYRTLKVRKRVSTNVPARTFLSSTAPAGALQYSGTCVQ